MLEIKDRNFIIDGKPTFLFGGEVHYFRLPRAAWEDRILKVKKAGGNLVSTYIPWLIHEPVRGDIDVTGRRRPENDLGYFLGLIKKHDMYCILRPGPYIMSELKNEGLPQWIYEDFKGSLALGKDGKTHPTNSFYLLDEDFLKLVDIWYTALGEIVRPYMAENGGPVIMAQLDNEIGMMHWCSGMADYTPKNLERFRKYLKDMYGDVLEDRDRSGNVNGGFYDFVRNPPQEYAAGIRADLSRYMRFYFKEYFMALQEKFHKQMGNVPVIVNVHGFDSVDIVKRGKQYPIGVAQLSEAAKVPGAVMAGDYYIGNIYFDNFQDIMLANAFTFAVQSGDQPLFSAEFQGGCLADAPRLQPTTFDLTTRICIANGMNGVNYYMFAGGTNIKGTDLLGLRHSWQAPVDTDGSLKPSYKVIRHLGNVLKACGQSLLSTRQEAAVHLGLVPDYYMTEYRDEFTAEMCSQLKFYREEYLYEGMGKGMSILNLTYEGYDLSGPEEIDVGKIPKLAVFLTRYLDRDIQEKLLRYIRNGGRLLTFPTLPVMDMACTVMLDALGCKAEVYDFGFAEYIDDVENLIINSSTDFGETEGSFARYETGYNCGFTKDLGKGRVVVFGAAMQHDFYYRDQVVLNQFEKIGVKPILTTDNIEDKLILTSRSNGSGGRYLFINNMDEYEKKTSVYLNGSALFGGKKLVVRARSGLMLPHHIELCPEIFVEYSTAEIDNITRTGEGKLKLTLSLTQPRDEILLKTSLVPEETTFYDVEKKDDRTWLITSNLHGAFYDKVEITFSPNEV